jgi:hypothetical protein
MNRRNFLRTTAATALAAPTLSALDRNAIIEMRYVRMRNSSDNQVHRNTEFTGKHLLPALQRAGIGPMGFFMSMIGPDSPFLLAVFSYPSLSAMEVAYDKLRADREYQKELAAFNSLPGQSFVRMEGVLLHAFDSIPNIEVPKQDGKRPPRIFELRTYESHNSKTLRRKIKMFNDSEIAIFRRCGILPVFFGETLIGRNMPNLTYMVAFDDLAAREKAWRTFGSDPEWKKLRVMPGYTDAEIVSNVSNVILRPMRFSPIR